MSNSTPHTLINAIREVRASLRTLDSVLAMQFPSSRVPSVSKHESDVILREAISHGPVSRIALITLAPSIGRNERIRSLARLVDAGFITEHKVKACDGRGASQLYYQPVSQ